MSYSERMARLTARKIEQTRVKQERLGARDEDDYGLVLPPETFKADLPVRDATGQFSGPRAWATNFRWLMERHPLYIDPDDAIAGRWMFMLSRMRLGYQLSRSNFAFDYSHLEPLQKKYDITTGIGKDAHFAPDYKIGLELGWGGLLSKVRASARQYASDAYAAELMEAEETAILEKIRKLLAIDDKVEASRAQFGAPFRRPVLRTDEDVVASALLHLKRRRRIGDGMPKTMREQITRAHLVDELRIDRPAAEVPELLALKENRLGTPAKHSQKRNC